MKDPAISPIIKLDNACCPHCARPILMITKSLDIVTLSSEGVPVTTENDSVKLVGVCPNCGETFNIVQTGNMQFTPVYDKEVYLHGQKNHPQEKFDDGIKTRDVYDKHMNPVETNPFKKEKENDNL